MLVRILNGETNSYIILCQFLHSLQEQQGKLKILAALKHCKDVARAKIRSAHPPTTQMSADIHTHTIIKNAIISAMHNQKNIYFSEDYLSYQGIDAWILFCLGADLFCCSDLLIEHS